MIQVDPSNSIFQKAVCFVNQTSRHLFLTGKAGTGKTTFLKYIREHSYKRMAVVAPTGVAAINAGGVTLHSFFQLPLGTFLSQPRGFQNFNGSIYTEHSLFREQRMSGQKKDLLNALELLIIDEISMVRADTLDAIDLVLRVRRKKTSLPFGGVQVIYIGDLFQLPPVVNDNEWELLKDNYKSPFFFDAQVLQQHPPVYMELKKIYRQSDNDFINLLNKVRNNCCSEEDLDMLHKYYQPNFIPAKEDNFITLTTHNIRADNINKTQLDKLSGKLWSYKAVITGEFNDRSYPADEMLQIKEGAQIMFIKNDKGEDRKYFNGKIGKVARINNDGIFISFKDEVGLLELQKEKWENIRYGYNKEKDSIESEELGTFSQYPIRLAWAITIHKSQGLTFNKAIIDAGASFAAGQVYVALSRLTSLAGLVLQSRITASCISTNEQAMEFLKNEMPEEELQELLKAEQENFVKQTLLKCFSFDKIAAALQQNEEEYEHRQIPEKQQAIKWNKELMSAVNELSATAGKFQQQLNLYFNSNEDAFKKINERTKAAVVYFSGMIDQRLIQPAEKHLNEIKNAKKVKKYLKQVNELKRLFLRQKELIKHAEKMTAAMNAKMEIGELLEITQQMSKPVIIEVVEENKSGKIVKGDTQKESLRMFKDGKSIAQIAEERRLAASTIIGHLTTFIVAGEININQLIEADQLKKLNTILDNLPEGKSLSEIKQLTGDNFSYHEIRAVLVWRESRVSTPTSPRHS